ncbi:hypothetical protein [uncultured Thiodictyon sp.]|uniref:hypothetical protein n=1 Tax=uncultured Thiodictyon sp. TaxID=1846217 RepID=UPI0025DBA5D4|nr:hypothetical protein [uncultured Thiodictyon sp.]
MAFTPEISESLARGADNNYLGSRQVVTRLLAEMLADWTKALASGSKERIVADAKALTVKYGNIFSGKNPAYQIIAGYNDFSLSNKLRVDLGEFWIKHHAEYDEKPVHCLMGYLLIMYANATKRHQHDEILVSAEFMPTLRTAIDLCLGTEKRVGM